MATSILFPQQGHTTVFVGGVSSNSSRSSTPSAPAAFILTINGKFNDWYVMYYLKKNYPELHKAWNEYYHKGKDAKAHRKELLDNPSTGLLFYEEFIRTNPPLNDESAQK